MIKEVIPSISYSLPTGTDTFIVTITISDNPLYFNEIYTATADQSVADIYAAYEAGKDVYASILGAYIPFVVGNSGRAEFEHIQHYNSVAVRFGLQGVADPDINSNEWTFRVTRSSFNIANLEYAEINATINASGYCRAELSATEYVIISAYTSQSNVVIPFVAASDNTWCFNVRTIAGSIVSNTSRLIKYFYMKK